MNGDVHNSEWEYITVNSHHLMTHNVGRFLIYLYGNHEVNYDHKTNCY